MRHVDVGEIVRAHRCYEGRDESLDTYVLDEDRLLDLLEPLLEEAESSGDGVVMDYHSCEFFPERYFDLVLVLQCETDVLYDRLTQRNYSDRKRSENVTAEIMQVILEEANQAYDPNIVHALPSNTVQDMDSNVDRVRTWMERWVHDRSREAATTATTSSDENQDESNSSSDGDGFDA